MASRSKKKRLLRSAVHVSCPIPNTHRRLEAAHRLWHESLNHYDDPEGFRTFLNSTIQELRNVTFVLQKERFSGADFDTWYAAWRLRLAPNKWVVELRNKVVKEGDLNTCSKVHARFFTGYWEHGEPKVFDGPPTTSSEAIANAIAATFTPEMRKNGLLVVERRWELPELPGTELLEGLASAYGLLADLVRDAHTLLEHTACGSVECKPDAGYSPEYLAGRPACMTVSQEARIASMDLQSSTFREARPRALNLRSGPDADRVLASYAEKGVTYPPIKGKPFQEQAGALHNFGLALLSVDGFLEFTFHLFRGPEVVDLFAARTNDRTDLTLVAVRLRDQVARTRADRVICSSEIWVGRVEFGNARDDPERTEAVNTTAVQADGFSLSLTTPFRREPSGIVFGDTSENTKTVLPFFAELVKYWRSL
jgi:hypothetical protein